MSSKKNLILGKIDISSLLSSYEQFEAGLKAAKSELEKAGVIQYFEFTFELAWKTMRRVLAERGKVLNSPKAVSRDAALEGLIEDPEVWFTFSDDRTKTVHNYDKKKANKIFNDLPLFSVEMKKFMFTGHALRARTNPFLIWIC